MRGRPKKKQSSVTMPPLAPSVAGVDPQYKFYRLGRKDGKIVLFEVQIAEEGRELAADTKTLIVGKMINKALEAIK